MPARAALLLFMAVLLPSCDGGDGGGAQVCIRFMASSAPASGTVVAREAGQACTVVTVELVVTDVSDVFSASFVAVFNPGLASYAGLDTGGSFLSSDGTALEVLEDVQSGRVTVGLTRLGSSTGIDVVGSEVLVKVLFRRVADSGSGILDLQNTKLLGSETPPQEKMGIQWFGGTLLIQ